MAKTHEWFLTRFLAIAGALLLLKVILTGHL